MPLDDIQMDNFFDFPPVKKKKKKYGGPTK